MSGTAPSPEYGCRYEYCVLPRYQETGDPFASGVRYATPASVSGSIGTSEVDQFMGINGEIAKVIQQLLPDMNTIFIHKIEKGNLSLLKVPVRKKTLLNFRDPADLNALLLLDRSVNLPFHFIKIIKKMYFGFFA